MRLRADLWNRNCDTNIQGAAVERSIVPLPPLVERFTARGGRMGDEEEPGELTLEQKLEQIVAKYAVLLEPAPGGSRHGCR